MLLSGWKAIAGYLGLGIRTAQRWEATGLPINRPSPGQRSHVVAYSEELDKWIRRYKQQFDGRPNVWINIEHARKVRQVAQAARNELRARMDVLKNEMDVIRAQRARRSTSPTPALPISENKPL